MAFPDLNNWSWDTLDEKTIITHNPFTMEPWCGDQPLGLLNMLGACLMMIIPIQQDLEDALYYQTSKNLVLLSKIQVDGKLYFSDEQITELINWGVTRYQ